ncbi:MAG: dienelactone hydrolase family protein [Proteobacteria bacterium]|nr:dienelactone hydrolase family protein [Pseudomonadota bacterium]
MKAKLWILMGCLCAAQASAALKSQTVEYSADGAPMEGYIAYDDAATSKQPGILIVPDWMGVSQFAKDKADLLAKEGYVAFVVDVYGKGVRPKDNNEAGKLATHYKSDRPLFRTRMKAALDEFTHHKEVNPQKIMVMGYCFGGTGALELARSGANVVGTATFHGGLSSPTPQDAKNIKGPVLVMHGADDPNVPPKEVAAFKEEMKNAKVKLTFIAYPGAVHAFTNPAAGNDNSKGAAYNKEADQKSWQAFEKFLKSLF